ncbi:MAG: ATP-binding cassette domain-containing protein, partial [Desulfuromonadales bacterium]|nr:ATP-binding cassette domain-containing protein [Desulfuromonadales bacterium]NIS40562.1 ATP-binding cassette domain-containing protein [Desulfuromonadales bacterium]
AGKSTLLRLLSGLEHPDDGSIRSNGKLLFDTGRNIALPPARRRTGLLFQHLALFPHLDVRANIGFGLKA